MLSKVIVGGDKELALAFSAKLLTFIREHRHTLERVSGQWSCELRLCSSFIPASKSSQSQKPSAALETPSIQFQAEEVYKSIHY